MQLFEFLNNSKWEPTTGFRIMCALIGGILIGGMVVWGIMAG